MMAVLLEWRMVVAWVVLLDDCWDAWMAATKVESLAVLKVAW
jgi:hypothetical protein